MRFVVGFGRFWWDFIIGEDWRIAAGVSTILAIGAILVALTGLGDAAITILTGAAIVGVVSIGIALPFLIRGSSDW